MNISQLAISLSADDIKTMINDFVQIEGLNLQNIEYEGDCLKVSGSFKKVISLGFSASVEVIGVDKNILSLSFKKASFMKIGILKTIRKIALKIALKGFKERGIELEGDKIKVDLKQILKTIKFIDLDLAEANINRGKIHIVAQNINIDLPGIAGKPTIIVDSNIEEPDLEKVNCEENDGQTDGLKNSDTTKSLEAENKKYNDEDECKDEDYIYNINIEKVEDAYTHGRERLVENIPENAKNYSDFIMFVPDLIALVFRLMKDKRVSKKTRIVLAISLGYTVIPFDIIPDKIPFLGQLDEIAVIFFALNRIINDIDTEILLENWQGKNELVLVLKQGVEYLSGFTGARDLNKIYNVIDSLA